MSDTVEEKYEAYYEDGWTVGDFKDTCVDLERELETSNDLLNEAIDELMGWNPIKSQEICDKWQHLNGGAND